VFESTQEIVDLNRVNVQDRLRLFSYENRKLSKDKIKEQNEYDDCIR